MSDWTIFGERLSHRMREYEISFRELSRRTGISVTTLHRYATSKRIPRITEIMKCADTLHTTVDYMLGLSDVPYLTGKGERIAGKEKKITRCKDCRYWVDRSCYERDHIRIGTFTHETDHCSWAERREKRWAD